MENYCKWLEIEKKKILFHGKSIDTGAPLLDNIDQCNRSAWVPRAHIDIHTLLNDRDDDTLSLRIYTYMKDIPVRIQAVGRIYSSASPSRTAVRRTLTSAHRHGHIT